MDTITTIQNLLKSNGSAQPVTVALMPSETRLIAAAPDMYEALDWSNDILNSDDYGIEEKLRLVHNRVRASLAKVQP